MFSLKEQRKMWRLYGLEMISVAYSLSTQQKHEKKYTPKTLHRMIIQLKAADIALKQIKSGEKIPKKVAKGHVTIFKKAYVAQDRFLEFCEENAITAPRFVFLLGRSDVLVIKKQYPEMAEFKLHRPINKKASKIVMNNRKIIPYRKNKKTKKGIDRIVKYLYSTGLSFNEIHSVMPEMIQKMQEQGIEAVVPADFEAS